MWLLIALGLAFVAFSGGDEKSKDRPKPPKPTPDPDPAGGDPAATIGSPLFTLRTPGARAEFRKHGQGVAWYVFPQAHGPLLLDQGNEPSAMAALEAAFPSFATQIMTGLVEVVAPWGEGDARPVTFDPAGDWVWKVSGENESHVSSSRGIAVRAMVQRLLLQQEGTAGAPKMQPGPEHVDVGIAVHDDCRRISVTNINRWIEWATPRVREVDWRQMPDPGSAIVERLFHEALPQCAGRFVDDTEIAGRTPAEILTGISHVAQRWRDAELVSVEEPEEILAARAVGSSVPKRDGLAEIRDHKGLRYLWVVDRPPARSDYRIRIWVGRREGPPIRTSSAQTLGEGVVSARNMIDSI